MKTLNADKKKRRGQALVEYVLIAGLTVAALTATAKIIHKNLQISNGTYIRIIQQIQIF